MKLLNKLILTIIILGLNISHSLAKSNPDADRLEYDVEIILFEDAHARYLNSQTWNTQPGLDHLQMNTEGNRAITNSNTAVYKNIKPSILSKPYYGLKVSSEYKVLFYGAWRQTGLEDSKAFEINIQDLKNNHKRTSANSISGSFKLVLARYLHIYSTLNYQRRSDLADSMPPNAESFAERGGMNNASQRYFDGPYPLNNHRRMRSKELHYIDHPLVGMLIQINPVAKPKVVPKVEPAAVAKKEATTK